MYKNTAINTLVLSVLTAAGAVSCVQGAFLPGMPAPVNADRSSLAKSALHGVSNSPVDWLSRRRFSYGIAGVVGGAVLPTAAQAADLPLVGVQAESLSLQSGLLESRVTENVLSPPPYGLEGPDVFYPSWFGGSWKVTSVGTQVLAPCGITLFGGNTTYQAALKEVGSTLSYESRFVSVGDDTTIADREFNVRSIAKAAMGANSVVDITLSSPNKFSCVLAPTGSPSLLRVDLITLLRRQENIDANHFDCSEVVREIVAPVGQPGPSSSSSASILKEVETISLYTYDPAKDMVRCRQRSAVFLLPSQQNPMAMKMFEYSRGRPIDARFYNVVYTRR